MKGRLRPQEATGLYLLVFAACLFFFVAGVLVGRWIPRQAEPPEFAQKSTSSDPEEDLGFYRELVGSGQGSRDATGSKVPKDSPAAEPASAQQESLPPPLNADPPTAAEGSFYTVQVGAMENQRTVNQLVMRLTAKGYPSRVIEPGSQGNQAYLIWVDDCETREEAEELETRLKGDGFQTYIKQVRGPVRR